MSADQRKVIVGGSFWALNGVNVFSENLTRGLRAAGFDAHILLTEENCELITIHDVLMERASDVPFVELPIDIGRSWGGHWGAMIRYLEDHAPCVYIPNSDWRHSSVTPVLSRGVRVVGVVHSDDPLHYNHVARLGRYWDAIVTTSPLIARKTVDLDPSLADRLSVIPIGVDIPTTPPSRPPRADSRLKLIYPGTLKQHQKRVFDLPKIVEAAAHRNLPVTLTIAGGGPDGEALKKACESLVARGLIDFRGVVEHGELLELLEVQDVIVMTSEFEGMPNALLEAMGRGCVPLVTDIESGVPQLVRDGMTGYLVPVGDINGFVDCLSILHSNPALCSHLSRRAHEVVSTGKFRVQDMVRSYAGLCERVLSESHTYRRPAGELNHPPPKVAQEWLFPVDLSYEVPGIGKFLAKSPDFLDFREHVRRIERLEGSPLRSLQDPRTRLRGVRVIVGSPAWTATGLNEFSANLVRQLRANGLDAHVLLTEEATDRVDLPDPRMARPPDVPFELLPVDRSASWGAHWGAMIRYLEDRAPCIYIPNHDWRHSCVCPLLSDAVAVIGVAFCNDPLHDDHVQRLGRYWNAIVAHDPASARRVKEDFGLGDRLAVFPHSATDPLLDYLELFAKVLDELRDGGFRRPMGRLIPPPREVAGVSIFPNQLWFEIDAADPRCAGETVDFREFRDQLRQLENPERSKLAGLVREPEDWLDGVEVIVGLPAWTGGEVDRCSAALVRYLRSDGIAAHILLTEQETDLVELPDAWEAKPSDVPFELLPVSRSESWGGHWGAMIRYLEDRAPCIYLPNHDWRHSCVSPVLSDQVAVVGVVQSGDPLHDDHVRRLGRYWNAIVTYDSSTAARVSELELAGHLAVFPYDPGSLQRHYVELFGRVVTDRLSGKFQRPPGVLQAPPSEVAGTSIFPADLRFTVDPRDPHVVNTTREFRELRTEVRQVKDLSRSPLAAAVRDPHSALEGVEVIVGSPAWTMNGINEFSATLVRQLRAGGIDARVLLTEEETDLVNDAQVRMPRSADIPFDLLPVERTDSWGGHWGAMIQYLESRSPCIYIPNHDWRHSCVTPLLSSDVAVVGVVHGNDALHDDHVRRLGRFWNAIVAYDAETAGRIAGDPDLARRLVVLPHGIEEGALDYLTLFAWVLRESRAGVFRRPAGRLAPPPAEIAGQSVFPVSLTFEDPTIGKFPARDPDFVQFERMCPASGRPWNPFERPAAARTRTGWWSADTSQNLLRRLIWRA